MRAPQAAYSHPTWAHAGKDMVGTSLGSSRLWFTVAEGIVTEIYYPRIDIPQIRDLGFIIADDQGFWIELRRLGNYKISLPKPYAPAVEIVHWHPRFNLYRADLPAAAARCTLAALQIGGRREFASLCAFVDTLGR